LTFAALGFRKAVIRKYIDKESNLWQGNQGGQMPNVRAKNEESP